MFLIAQKPLLFLLLASSALATSPEQLFKEFEEKFGKVYETAEQRIHRLQIFSANLPEIAAIQAADPSAQYSHLTPFADWTPEEFASRNTLRPQALTAGRTEAPPLSTKDLPTGFDWRDKGAVNPVKNQGSCGSCWAFSTVANIEGVNFLKTNQLLSLSEQELVDCDKKTGDQGCSGGRPTQAFEDMVQNKIGLELETDYPYKEPMHNTIFKPADRTCNATAGMEKVFITNYTKISSDEDQIAAALVQYGPLSIGINAGPMQWYSGGVSKPWKSFCSPSTLDHGVAIVGFGEDSGTKYWIIRNSWGEGWGEKGYYRIERGTGACGLNTDVNTAIIHNTASVVVAEEEAPLRLADIVV